MHQICNTTLGVTGSLDTGQLLLPAEPYTDCTCFCCMSPTRSPHKCSGNTDAVPSPPEPLSNTQTPSHPLPQGHMGHSTNLCSTVRPIPDTPPQRPLGNQTTHACPAASALEPVASALCILPQGTLRVLWFSTPSFLLSPSPCEASRGGRPGQNCSSFSVRRV